MPATDQDPAVSDQALEYDLAAQQDRLERLAVFRREATHEHLAEREGYLQMRAEEPLADLLVAEMLRELDDEMPPVDGGRSTPLRAGA